MVFQKEHAIAGEYIYEIEENLGFTHNVSNRSLHYHISFKLDNKNFSAERDLKKFNKLYDDYNLVDEGWEKFNYRIEKAPSWSEFDSEVIVYSKRVSFFKFYFSVF